MKLSISLIIFIAIILGLFFPFGTLIKDLTSPLLFVLMYFSILELDLKLKKFFKKEIFYWGLINIIILPIFAYFIGSFLSEYFLLGMVVAALAPAAVNSPMFVNLLKGDKELSISISAIANLSSIIYVPLMLFLLFGLNLIIPYTQILTNIFTLIFIPIFLVVLTKKFLKSKYNKILDSSKIILKITLFLIIWIIFSTSSKQFFSSLNEVLIIIPLMFLITITGLLLGYFSSKKKELKRTLAISCSYKNQTLLLGVVSSINPLIAVPPILYIIAFHIVNGIFIWLYEKKKI